MILIVLKAEKNGGSMGGSKNRFNCSSSIIQLKKTL